MRTEKGWMVTMVGSLALVALAACGGKDSGSEPCGDGVVDTAESCDDGNRDVGDGCDDQCSVEDGWTCNSEPSVCAPVCGDGLVVGGEQCDDGNAATGDGCDDQCSIEDGWTCDDANPSVCVTQCGDGVVAGDELCDGADLDDQTCALLGLGDGILACGADCLFNVAGCPITAECGNGTWEYPEDCDATDLAGQDCTTLGFTGGDLHCTGSCNFDTSGCTSTGPVCGDAVQEGTEQCDGADLGGETCVGLGHLSGTLGCTAACTFDQSQCVDCGPGLTACGTECVDVLNDPDYCGAVQDVTQSPQ